MKRKRHKKAQPAKERNNNVKEGVPSGNAYLLKENALQQLPPEFRSILLSERKFKSAKEMEQLVLQNSKALFGEHIFLIRKASESANKSNAASVLLMLEFNTPLKPRLCILDIVFKGSNFFSSVLPRVTGYLAYLKNENTDQLWELLGGNKGIGGQLKDVISSEGIPEFLQNILRNRPTILLVTEDEIPEVTQMQATYSEWHRVMPLFIKKYVSNGNTICTISPPFAEMTQNEKEKKVKKERVIVAEDEHLRNVSENVRQAYLTIKTELLKTDSGLIFNSQRYYISIRKQRNLAVFHFSKKKITLVVLVSEEEARQKIKYHVIKTLTPKVMQFWGGPSCSLVIEDSKHLQEIMSLLKKLINS